MKVYIAKVTDESDFGLIIFDEAFGDMQTAWAAISLFIAGWMEKNPEFGYAANGNVYEYTIR